MKYFRYQAYDAEGGIHSGAAQCDDALQLILLLRNTRELQVFQLTQIHRRAYLNHVRLSRLKNGPKILEKQPKNKSIKAKIRQWVNRLLAD